MKNILFLALTATILFSCSSDKTNEEKEKLDQLTINSTNDKVSYAIGYTSAGELTQFTESSEYGAYFSKEAIKKGFFAGILSKDTVKADECDATLSNYFKTRGSFDTSKIRPAEASHCLGFIRGIGINYSLSNKGLFKDLSTDLMKRGFRDALFHQDTLIEINEQMQAITEYFGAIIKKDGEAFLAKNKLRSEVTTTDNGLQIETIKEGKGKTPTLSDTVAVYYTLSTVNGQVLESNVGQPNPVEFNVNGVIEGWKQGLQLMKEGGEYMLYVPYELGYGFQGNGKVKPYAALVFNVKLVDVK